MTTVSDHLNTVREALEKRFLAADGTPWADIERWETEALTTLGAIEAAYDQRDKAFLDLLESSADKEAEIVRLRTELASLLDSAGHYLEQRWFYISP